MQKTLQTFTFYLSQFATILLTSGTSYAVDAEAIDAMLAAVYRPLPVQYTLEVMHAVESPAMNRKEVETLVRGAIPNNIPENSYKEIFRVNVENILKQQTGTAIRKERYTVKGSQYRRDYTSSSEVDVITADSPYVHSEVLSNDEQSGARRLMRLQHTVKRASMLSKTAPAEVKSPLPLIIGLHPRLRDALLALTADRRMIDTRNSPESNAASAIPDAELVRALLAKDSGASCEILPHPSKAGVRQLVVKLQGKVTLSFDFTERLYTRPLAQRVVLKDQGEVFTWEATYINDKDIPDEVRFSNSTERGVVKTVLTVLRYDTKQDIDPALLAHSAPEGYDVFDDTDPTLASYGDTPQNGNDKPAPRATRWILYINAAVVIVLVTALLLRNQRKKA